MLNPDYAAMAAVDEIETQAAVQRALSDEEEFRLSLRQHFGKPPA